MLEDAFPVSRGHQVLYPQLKLSAHLNCCRTPECYTELSSEGSFLIIVCFVISYPVGS